MSSCPARQPKAASARIRTLPQYWDRHPACLCPAGWSGGGNLRALAAAGWKHCPLFMPMAAAHGRARHALRGKILRAEEPASGQQSLDVELSHSELSSRVQQVARLNGIPVAPAAVAQAGHINRLDRTKAIVNQFTPHRGG